MDITDYVDGTHRKSQLRIAPGNLSDRGIDIGQRLGERSEAYEFGFTRLGKVQSGVHSALLGLLAPGAETVHKRSGAVAKPAIKLGLILELLSPQTRDNDVPAA